MSMNFYLKSNYCESCGRHEYELQIGLSSFGWQFIFRGYPELMIVSYDHWRIEFEKPGICILDEDGERYSVPDFEKMIYQKKKGMNATNIYKKKPETDKEKKYIEINRITHPSSGYWNDNDGNPFTSFYIP